jgi:hypothetical protein
VFGVPGEQGRDDRIEIVYYNQHGVGHQTILAFDSVGPNLVADQTAATVDALAAHQHVQGQMEAAASLTDVAGELRYTWDTLAEVLDRLASTGPTYRR